MTAADWERRLQEEYEKRGALMAENERLREAIDLALRGLPDPMHPSIPPRMVDGLVCAQIVLRAALGGGDHGNVESARAALGEQP